MRISKVVAVMLVFAVLAFSQDAPNAFRPVEIGWNVFSYARSEGVNYYGGDLSLSVYPAKRVGIAADVAIHKATIGDVTATNTTYVFGPKLVTRHGKRLTGFAEFLVGGTRTTGSASVVSGGLTTTSSASFNGFALAWGGGFDVGIRPWLAVRPVQLDMNYFHIGSLDSSSTGFRIGGGFVFRMGPH